MIVGMVLVLCRIFSNLAEGNLRVPICKDQRLSLWVQRRATYPVEEVQVVCKAPNKAAQLGEPYDFAIERLTGKFLFDLDDPELDGTDPDSKAKHHPGRADGAAHLAQSSVPVFEDFRWGCSAPFQANYMTDQVELSKYDKAILEHFEKLPKPFHERRHC